MHNVCTFEACESVRKATESKGDERMLHVLLSVNNDLIAAEAKYHKTCFASYISRSNLRHKSFKEIGEASYDTAFGKNEEQLPQKTVGRLLANSRPTVGQRLANSRTTVGQLSFTAFYENLLPAVG